MFDLRIVAVIAVAIILYLLEAIGVFTLSKRLGLDGAARAFIPYAKSYALGNLAGNLPDGNDGLKPQLKRNLFALKIASGGLITVAAIVTGLLLGYLLELSGDGKLDSISAQGQMALIFIMALIIIVALAVTAVYAVFRYIALWRIFSRLCENSAVALLALSVILPPLSPIFIFSIRNKVIETPTFTVVTE